MSREEIEARAFYMSDAEAFVAEVAVFLSTS